MKLIDNYRDRSLVFLYFCDFLSFQIVKECSEIKIKPILNSNILEAHWKNPEKFSLLLL